MKKGIFAILAVLTVFAITMAGCGGGSTTPIIPPPPKTYTVKFVSNGGSPVADQKVAIGSKVNAKKAAIERELWEFDGWYPSNVPAQQTAENEWVIGTNKLTKELVDNEDKTFILYAKWKEVSGTTYYTLSFEYTDIPSYKVANGEKLYALNDPAKDDLEFGGWYKSLPTAASTDKWIFRDQEGTADTISGNTTLYAKWTATVTFSMNGGLPNVASEKVIVTDFDNGITISEPSAPSRTDTTFDAWFTTATFGPASKWNFTTKGIVKSITLYARFTVQITFEVDKTNYTTYPGSDPAAVTITADTGLGNRLKNLEVEEDKEIEVRFDKWYIKDTTTAVTSGTPFAKNTTLIGKFVTDNRLVITFEYNNNGGTAYVVVRRLDEGQTFEAAGQKLPTADTKDDWYFGGWKVKTDTSDTLLTEGSSFLTNTTVDAVWWSTALTSDSDTLEKVWLNNAQYAVYEFDLTGKDYTKITHISANFKVSEAVIKSQQIRAVRPMGPYFYSDTPTTGATSGGITDYYYGDFVVDTNGAYAAKFNSSGAALWTDFNKFHPYLLNNVLGNAGWSAVDAYSTGTNVVQADKWFNLKVATSSYAWNDGTNNPARVKGYIDADTEHKVHSIGTDYTKVYFGFGIPNASNPDDAAKGQEAIADIHGITTLVKDVTIYFDDNSTLTGKVPSLPLRERKDDGDDGTSTLVTGKTTDQVFASYIYNIQYNWRGDKDGTVKPPFDAKYEKPDVPEPAEDILVLEGADVYLTAYGTNADKVTIAGAKATVALSSTEYNPTACGFWVALPDDWNAYEKIEVYYNATVTSDVAKVTIKQGQASFTDYAHLSGNDPVDSRWKDVSGGIDNVYTFRTAGFNNASNMATPGISFQINNNASTDVPQNWTFTITQIVLTPVGF